MIVTRGLGRPATGALVAFGLALTSAYIPPDRPGAAQLAAAAPTVRLAAAA